MRAGGEARSAGLVDQLAHPVLFGHQRVCAGFETGEAALQVPPPQPGRRGGFSAGALKRSMRAGELGADGLFAGDQFLTAHGLQLTAHTSGRRCARACTKTSASASSLYAWNETRMNAWPFQRISGVSIRYSS
jgi:hypothetical protein